MPYIKTTPEFKICEYHDCNEKIPGRQKWCERHRKLKNYNYASKYKQRDPKKWKDYIYKYQKKRRAEIKKNKPEVKEFKKVDLTEDIIFI